MYGTFSDDPAATSNLENVVLLQPINNFSPRRRRWRACIYYCIFVLFAVVAVWLVLVYFLAKPPFSCLGHFPVISPPASKVPQDWNAFRNQSWAVGFDLTAGYGTSSVAFNNGTIVDVVKWQQGTQYNDVLARASMEEAQHPTPPYYNCTAIREDVGRQWNRWWRKKRGMPASDDVLALVSALLLLKTDTNAWLRKRGTDEMQVVFVTVPLLPAMYMEDLVDAVAFVGLQVLTLPWGIHGNPFSAHLPVTEINTAFAGMGLGLDGIFPSKNETEPWSENTFSVLFTKKAFTAQVSRIKRAPNSSAAEGIANFSLGLEAMDAMGNETYWHAVRGALKNALDPYSYRYWHGGHELGRVIVYGEAAGNDIFQEILREEVTAAQWSNEEEKQPRFWSVDPVFAGSRGAAIFGNWCQRGLGKNWYGCFPNLTPDGPPWF
jgi:hypothetical protein